MYLERCRVRRKETRKTSSKAICLQKGVQRFFMTILKVDERTPAVRFDPTENESFLSNWGEGAVSFKENTDGTVDVKINLKPLLSCPVVLKGLIKRPNEIVVGLDTIVTEYPDGTRARKLKISLEPDGDIPSCCVECDGRVVCGRNACIVCDNGFQICCIGQ